MKIGLCFHGQDFRRATKNYLHDTELSSVLFGGISCSFLPYAETQDIAIQHFMISLLFIIQFQCDFTIKDKYSKFITSTSMTHMLQSCTICPQIFSIEIQSLFHLLLDPV